MKLIQIIKDKDYCVCELEITLNKSQPSISHHLKLLEKAELIREWKKGKFTHYSLMKEQFKRYLDTLNNNFTFEI